MALSPAPHRIQRKRIRGWRKPPGVIHVGAPSVFANRFRDLPLDQSLRLYRALYDDAAFEALGPQDRKVFLSRCPGWSEADIGSQLWQEVRISRKASLRRLRGRDLCCWCALDQPCHADILLELANAPDEAGEPTP